MKKEHKKIKQLKPLDQVLEECKEKGYHVEGFSGTIYINIEDHKRQWCIVSSMHKFFGKKIVVSGIGDEKRIYNYIEHDYGYAFHESWFELDEININFIEESEFMI